MSTVTTVVTMSCTVQLASNAMFLQTYKLNKNCYEFRGRRDGSSVIKSNYTYKKIIYFSATVMYSPFDLEQTTSPPQLLSLVWIRSYVPGTVPGML